MSYVGKILVTGALIAGGYLAVDGFRKYQLYKQVQTEVEIKQVKFNNGITVLFDVQVINPSNGSIVLRGKPSFAVFKGKSDTAITSSRPDKVNKLIFIKPKSTTIIEDLEFTIPQTALVDVLSLAFDYLRTRKALYDYRIDVYINAAIVRIGNTALYNMNFVQTHQIKGAIEKSDFDVFNKISGTNNDCGCGCNGAGTCHEAHENEDKHEDCGCGCNGAGTCQEKENEQNKDDCGCGCNGAGTCKEEGELLSQFLPSWQGSFPNQSIGLLM